MEHKINVEFTLTTDSIVNILSMEPAALTTGQSFALNKRITRRRGSIWWMPKRTIRAMRMLWPRFWREAES